MYKNDEFDRELIIRLLKDRYLSDPIKMGCSRQLAEEHLPPGKADCLFSSSARPIFLDLQSAQVRVAWLVKDLFPSIEKKEAVCDSLMQRYQDYYGYD